MELAEVGLVHGLVAEHAVDAEVLLRREAACALGARREDTMGERRFEFEFKV